MKKIAIRFGHTILINGQCTSASGIKSEYTLIREYAPLVIKYLKEQGYDVLNITPKDKSFDNEIKDINAGIQKANEWKADLFVSLHCNCSDGNGHGCEVLYSNGNEEGQRIATNISNEISKLGFRNRGAKADVRGLNEMRKTSMRALIIEPLFCDSKVDMNLYNADKLAKSIVKGITGKEVKSSPTIPQNNKPINKTTENPIKFIKECVVNCTKLNCREFPINGKILKTYEKNDRLTVVDYDSTKKWGKLISGSFVGWISLSYVKFI